MNDPRAITSRIPAFACFLCLSVYAGCILAADPAGEKPVPLKVQRILFLGNSITLHGPLAEIGWAGDWGMAASAREKDYVHVLTDSIAKLSGSRPEVRIANIADFERHYETYDASSKLKEQLDFKADLIVVAVGENVPPLAGEEAKAKFKDRFGKLLATLQGSGRPLLLVRSCFWADKSKDEIMLQSCRAARGVFVDISRLGKDDSNQARSERNFAHGGVASHPGDKGMKAIADAMLEALGNASRCPERQ